MGPTTIKFCIKIFNSSAIDTRVNTTYLCLIPKCSNAINLKNFRPIRLYNIRYNIITKIIVNGLKPLFTNLISPTQSSFLPSRRTSDNAIIVQEVINHFRKIKGKKTNMILKIDLEKAFDRLECSFIRQTLHFFNILPKLVTLIMSCILTSSISILVNSEKIPFFNPTKGIRQGDPISLFIFIMCME